MDTHSKVKKPQAWQRYPVGVIIVSGIQFVLNSWSRSSNSKGNTHPKWQTFPRVIFSWLCRKENDIRTVVGHNELLLTLPSFRYTSPTPTVIFSLSLSLSQPNSLKLHLVLLTSFLSFIFLYLLSLVHSHTGSPKSPTRAWLTTTCTRFQSLLPPLPSPMHSSQHAPPPPPVHVPLSFSPFLYLSLALHIS